MAASPQSPPWCEDNTNSVHPTMSDETDAPRFSLGKRIWQGESCQVFLGADAATGAPVAVKHYPRDRLDPTTEEYVLQEISLHASLDHPHILPVLAAMRNDSGISVVLPFASNGDLYERFADLDHSERTIARHVLAPLLSALAYVHARGIVHRDIKLENVLLDGRGRVLLADFGFALDLQRRRALTHVGTRVAMAPEVLLGDPAAGPDAPLRCEVPRDARPSYGTAADIWALGVLAFELLTGRVPFAGSDDRGIARAIFASHAGLRAGVSPLALDFLRRCLTFDARERPTARDLLSHPLLVAHCDPTRLAALVDAVADSRPLVDNRLLTTRLESRSQAAEGPSESGKTFSPAASIMGGTGFPSPTRPRHLAVQAPSLAGDPTGAARPGVRVPRLDLPPVVPVGNKPTRHSFDGPAPATRGRCPPTAHAPLRGRACRPPTPRTARASAPWSASPTRAQRPTTGGAVAGAGCRGACRPLAASRAAPTTSPRAAQRAYRRSR